MRKPTKADHARRDFPAISIIDPELMLTLPHKLTLFQGFDAVPRLNAT
ncbi:MAG: hypothetical protein ACLSTO_09905 [Bilophila wadsworthia]